MAIRIIDPEQIDEGAEDRVVFLVETINPSDGTSRAWGAWSSRPAAREFLASPLGRALLATYDDSPDHADPDQFIRPLPLDALVADPRDLEDALDDDINPL